MELEASQVVVKIHDHVLVVHVEDAADNLLTILGKHGEMVANLDHLLVHLAILLEDVDGEGQALLLVVLAIGVLWVNVNAELLAHLLALYALLKAGNKLANAEDKLQGLLAGGLVAHLTVYC